jgi:hypothetical protein
LSTATSDTAGALHDRLAGRVCATHQQRRSDHPFIADQPDLRRRAILEHGHQRYRRRGRKENVLERDMLLVQNLAQRHRYRLQVRVQPLEGFSRQACK